MPFPFFPTSGPDDYHQPTDTLATIDATMMRTAAEAVFRDLQIDGLVLGRRRQSDIGRAASLPNATGRTVPGARPPLGSSSRSSLISAEISSPDNVGCLLIG